jgi:hypothetical protein
MSTPIRSTDYRMATASGATHGIAAAGAMM